MSRESGAIQIDISWSGEIDGLGGPQKCSGILAVEVSCELYVRRDDGEAFRDGTRISIEHNFENSPYVVKFGPSDEWARFAQHC